MSQYWHLFPPLGQCWNFQKMIAEEFSKEEFDYVSVQSPCLISLTAVISLLLCVLSKSP